MSDTALILQKIESMGESLNNRMDGMEKRLNSRIDGLENRMDSLENRMDSLEGQMNRQFGEVKDELEVHRSVLNVILNWTDQIAVVEPKLPRIGSQSMYGN